MLAPVLKDTKTGLNMQGFYQGNKSERKRLGRLGGLSDPEAKMTLCEGERKQSWVEVSQIVVNHEEVSGRLSWSL